MGEVKRGAVIGAGFSAFYIAYVILLLIIAGSEKFASSGLNPWLLMCLYLIAGTGGGALAAGLRPLGRSVVGSMVLGTMVAGLAMLGLMSAQTWVGKWTADHWIAWGLSAVFFGMVGGPFIRRLFG